MNQDPTIPIDAAVDFMLNLHRPDRYNTGDTSWQEPAVQMIAEQFTVEEITAAADAKKAEAADEAEAAHKAAADGADFLADLMQKSGAQRLGDLFTDPDAP